MTTQFDDNSVINAKAEMTPVGSQVIVLLEGKRELAMFPEQAADFAALLISKASEALSLGAEQGFQVHAPPQG